MYHTYRDGYFYCPACKSVAPFVLDILDSGQKLDVNCSIALGLAIMGWTTGASFGSDINANAGASQVSASATPLGNRTVYIGNDGHGVEMVWMRLECASS